MDLSLEEDVFFTIWCASTLTQELLGLLCDSIEAVNFLEVLSLSGAHLCDSTGCELCVHVQPIQEVSRRSLAVRVARGVAEEAKSQGLLLGLVSWVEWLEGLVTECSPPVVS